MLLTELTKYVCASMSPIHRTTSIISIVIKTVHISIYILLISATADCSAPASDNSTQTLSCDICEEAYIAGIKALKLSSLYDPKGILCDRTIVSNPSSHPLIIGVGPGTTGTKSVALALYMMGKSVLHYSYERHATFSTGKDLVTMNTELTNLQKRIAHHGLASNTSTDELLLFSKTEAILDHPFDIIGNRIKDYFPSARAILTWRSPRNWCSRRVEFCRKFPQNEFLACAAPYMISPHGLHLTDMSLQQCEKSFNLTVQYYQCLFGERLLVVDLSAPPDIGWFHVIAEFIGVNISKSSVCKIPGKLTHRLQCHKSDSACQACVKEQALRRRQKSSRTHD
eukprot:m.1351607 g.1351607  ORF g.1351607 m.1351607 type:complete len:340 (-) comp24923_c0_seq24:1612-2631(-)